MTRRVVGGGFYSKVELLPDEALVSGMLCAFSTNRLAAQFGYLTITDQRLIFTADRFNLGINLLFGGSRRSIPYQEIDHIEIQRWLNLSMSIMSLASALIIQTRSGRHFIFWPSVGSKQAQALVDQIEDLRRSAGS